MNIVLVTRLPLNFCWFKFVIQFKQRKLQKIQENYFVVEFHQCHGLHCSNELI